MAPIILAAVMSATGNAPACQAVVVKRGGDNWEADAALVSTVTHRPTRAVQVEAVFAMGGWRVIWATPRDMEPGVFFFHAAGGRLRTVDTWGGVTGEAGGAYRWARKLGAPAALSRCFADRLVADGP